MRRPSMPSLVKLFLGSLAANNANIDNTWWDMFVGTIPGSIAETSTLMALIGAVYFDFYWSGLMANHVRMSYRWGVHRTDF